MIRFKCGGCGATMESPQSMAGEVETCPQCGSELRVPVPPPLAAPAPTAEQMRAVAGIPASDRPHRKSNTWRILLLVGIGGMLLVAAGWITWRCLDADAQSIIQEVSGWVFFLFCVIAILCVFFSMPGWIARDRRLANADGIMTMGRVGLLFPPLWLVAFILALAGTPRPYDFAITTRRPCPECGESIARTARKCRFCGAAV